ncbi:MFS transporter [Amycolatopsis sp. H20-H5]|uniref:MFS transporter n=1 Tax=Amycolatopsis sp. H20-H5 TaxID=3046309 RepID=UPI002DBA8722|nr:MFS transporter [Amycolatopsis sp. H20-H5]MEC3979550.1 MFS transporter [Amycolatopsis sp. H20-H5]
MGVVVGQEPRRARVAVSVVFAACGAGFSTWAARVPAVQDKLGLSAGQLAVGLFGLAAGSVVMLLAAGPLLTKIGSRTGAVAGAVVLCSGLPLVAFAPGPGTLIAALAVLGMGNSLLDVSMNAHAARVEQEYGRPIFAGFHAFWNIGGLVGSGIGGLMAVSQVPVTVHFALMGVALLAVTVGAVGFGFLPGADQGQGGTAFALPGRALIPLGAIAFCGFFAEGTVNDWSAVYLNNVTSASAAFASLGYFAFSTTMIAVRLVTDRLVAQVGPVRFVRVATAVTVAGFALVVAVPAPTTALVGFAVVGLGVAGIVPVAWSAAGRQPGDSPGRAIAAVAACGYLGFLLCPVLVGALTAWIGLQGALAAAGTLTGAIVCLAPTLRPREQPDT